MNDITLIFPEVSEDLVSQMLRAITKKINDNSNGDYVQGFLGGENGYGAYYKNDVFEMRPFYWGECECEYDGLRDAWEEANPHAQDCYQTIFHDMHYVNYGVDWNFDTKPGHGWKKGTVEDECNCVDTLYIQFNIPKGTPGSHAHCTCDRNENYSKYLNTIFHSDECQVDKPNFKHYASGIEVNWYKYIGRDMDYDESITVEKWVEVFKDCLESIKSGEKLGGK